MDIIEKPIILIVDDTPENIDILRGVLHEEYKVKAVLNGLKALTIAEKSPQPSMILLDIMMPDMDGYEVCKKLKENPTTENIPVIFISAKSLNDDKEKGLKLGAVDYIAKPIIPAVTLVKIREHLLVNK